MKNKTIDQYVDDIMIGLLDAVDYTKEVDTKLMREVISKTLNKVKNSDYVIENTRELLHDFNEKLASHSFYFLPATEKAIEWYLTQQPSIGDEVFEIHSVNNTLYVNTRKIKKITSKNRIICDLDPFEGIKMAAINQFNRQYRCWDIRGNHLNMFRCYSFKQDLNKNIELFQRKFKKITGYDIGDAVFNSYTKE